MDELKDPSIKFMNPFMAFTTEAILTDRLVEVFKDIPAEEVKAAAMLPGKNWHRRVKMFRKRAKRPFSI